MIDKLKDEFDIEAKFQKHFGLTSIYVLRKKGK